MLGPGTWFGGAVAMRNCRKALSALALASACLPVMAAAGALAQEASRPPKDWHKKPPSVPPQLMPWTDSADPAALKTCRENIAQPSSGTKVGPLQPLRGASVLPAPNRAGMASKKLVGASNVRMYAARVQTTNLWGNPVDLHDVCFFEKAGSTYRFVQVCRMKIKRARPGSRVAMFPGSCARLMCSGMANG